MYIVILLLILLNILYKGNMFRQKIKENYHLLKNLNQL